MEFTAIDFETANRGSDSACSIGLARVKDGKIVEEFYSLLRPKKLYFYPDNIKIHGITEEMAADAPTLPEVWQKIAPFLQDKQVVAHFAKFDMGVLRASLSSWGMRLPEFDYICSFILAKKAFPHLESFALNNVAQSVGFKFQHHHALEDAKACATVVSKVMQTSGTEDFVQLARYYDFECGRMWSGGVRPCTAERPKEEQLMGSLFE